MGKRIAIFCDGTWSTLREEQDKERPETNVAILYRALKDVKPGDGATQLCEHFSGIGVERDRLLGGATGRGLDRKIQEAYVWLCQNYDVGDDIFLFGFSRGAYTARSLAGLIRTVGFIQYPDDKLVDRAMALYRKRDKDKADHARADAFRKENAKAWVESDADGPCLVKKGGEKCDPRHAIRYLGIWDTVGALGVPNGTPFAASINRRHRFHDTELSRMVASARHALAADELRVIFSATPWSNLDKLNQGLPEPRYLQAWFPGDHGSVGGGGAERRLSDAALLWVAIGAAQAGLTIDFDHPEMKQAQIRADVVKGPLSAAPGGMLDWLTGKKWRGEMLPADVAYPGTLERIKADPKYRPQPLKRYWPDQKLGR